MKMHTIISFTHAHALNGAFIRLKYFSIKIIILWLLSYSHLIINFVFSLSYNDSHDKIKMM